MRIVLTGSGSGGHFYPLIAIAGAIHETAKKQKILLPELYFMGPDPYDEGSLFASSVTFIRVPAGKLRRYRSLKNVVDLLKTIGGTGVALWKLFVMYPDVVMSKGGYTSTPVIIAAWLLRIPIVIHESDAKPGRANKLASKFARYIAISYDDTVQYFPEEKVALTGIPVRHELLAPPPANTHEALNITDSRALLLILGGSQGAERINDLIISALEELLSTYEVIHQTGPNNATAALNAARTFIHDEEKLRHYHAHAFFDVTTLHAALSFASLIISRAGSGSIFEIALHGKPSILVPIPEDVSHDQRTNAYAYARTGSASVIEEENLTPNLLVAEITRIMSDRPLLEKMSTKASEFAPREAAERIAEALLAVTLEHGY